MLVEQPDAAFTRSYIVDDPAAAPASAVPVATAALAGLSIAIHDSLRAVEAPWRAFEAVADCTAFQTFDWHDAWQKTIGNPAGVRPAIAIARDGDTVVAIFPFQVERGRLVSVLRWHASELCDYNTPLLAADFAGSTAARDFRAFFAALATLIQRAPGLHFDAAELTKMPERVGGQPNPFMALPSTLNPSGAYATPIYPTWDDFYAAKRSSATRRRDRTKRKRLGELGTVAFVTAATPAEKRAALDLLMAQKSKAFARTGVPDLFARPGYRDFYKDIASRSGGVGGFVHVSRLAVGDEPAALNLGLLFRGAYYHVLASYGDGPASRFGPGVAHLHELMGYAIDNGCTVFDFTIGDERYKSEWSEGVLRLHDHRCATSLKGRLAMLPVTLAARAKRTVKQNPVLWAWAQKVRAGLAGLRGGSPAAERRDGED